MQDYYDAPGGVGRPIGKLDLFLEDVKARGFFPRGIIDVGANRGDWTRFALGIFPSTPFIMIEPQDEMEMPLSQVVNDSPGCHYIKAGAGREEGELIQTIWEDLLGSSFLPVVDSEQLKTGTQRKTKIVTIDSLLATLPDFHPDFVKLDTQGFELEALLGGESLFGKTELFIIETSLFPFMPKQPITREVIAFMGDRGYELYEMTQFLRRPCDGAIGQVDLSFVKAEGMFRQNARWA